MRRVITHLNSTIPPNSGLAAAAALAASAVASSWVYSARPNEERDGTLSPVHKAQQQPLERRCHSGASSHSITPTILASSSTNNLHLHSNEQGKKNINAAKETILECDYVVIGHGKAGRSAVRTIKELDPTAIIAIVDPNNNPATQSYNVPKQTDLFGNSKAPRTTHHVPTRASYIDHANKLIRVHPIIPTRRASNASNSNNMIKGVQYRKSALLATGSRGAPPPDSCVRPDARSRILELRSTGLQAPSDALMPNAQLQSSPNNTSITSATNLSMPVLDPTTVRSITLMAASQGATIAIMGSGFEALELAAYCARISPKPSAANSTSQDKGENNKIVLLFGNSGPLSNCIPRYLSAAVTKRLRQFGIDVEDRAMTRYVSMDSGRQGSAHETAQIPPKLELYTVKSYDSLDTKRVISDLLVLAPDVDGLHGTAVIPTDASSTVTSNNNNHIYQPWSSLITPPLLTCYHEDARIVANTELNVASNLWAAGSVARHPNSRSGKATMAGGRCMSADDAGRIAATNMVAEGSHIGAVNPDYSTGEIPVWRSDIVPYLPQDDENEQVPSKARQSPSSPTALALYSMGIHALCVGRCDSEEMATHGFWWTNTNQHSSTNESKDGKRRNTNRSIGPNAFMRRATKRMTNRMSKLSMPSNSSRGSLPVYGSGVVFYLSRSGCIEGIMLWGLPFSTNVSEATSALNESLVERMKDMIRSNGAIAIQDHSEKILAENSGAYVGDIVDLLSYLHLAEESKHLASLALSGGLASERAVSVLGRPLHRYTPTKSAELTKLGKVNRMDDQGNSTDEDDLFYSTHKAAVNELGRPPSLKRIYPMQQADSIAINTPEYNELEMRSKQRQIQLQQSRPPKEDPLWLRQGEETRFINRREVIAESFQKNLQSGRFKDGRDAVRQAPVPQSLLNMKSKWNEWTSDEKESEEEE